MQTITKQLNHISYGPNDAELNVAGYTVAQVEEALYEVLNLSCFLLCYVDGVLVRDKRNFVLGVRSSVMFWKPFGVKGSGDSLGERQTVALERIAQALERVADHFDPPLAKIVDTNYVAARLGVSVDYVGEMAREKTIPGNCVVVGTGDGKAWKFYRKRIENWIESR